MNRGVFALKQGFMQLSPLVVAKIALRWLSLFSMLALLCGCSFGSGCDLRADVNSATFQLRGLDQLPNGAYELTVLLGDRVYTCSVELADNVSVADVCQADDSAFGIATLDGQVLTLSFASAPATSATVSIESEGELIFTTSVPLSYETRQLADCHEETSHATVTIEIEPD